MRIVKLLYQSLIELIFLGNSVQNNQLSFQRPVFVACQLLGRAHSRATHPATL